MNHDHFGYRIASEPGRIRFERRDLLAPAVTQLVAGVAALALLVNALLQAASGRLDIAAILAAAFVAALVVLVLGTRWRARAASRPVRHVADLDRALLLDAGGATLAPLDRVRVVTRRSLFNSFEGSVRVVHLEVPGASFPIYASGDRDEVQGIETTLRVTFRDAATRATERDPR